MATKRSAIVGYTIEQDQGHGIISEQPVEVSVRGDMLRNNPRMSYSGSVNGTMTMSMSFSFIADAFAFQHMTKIRYLIFNGEAWTVNTIQEVRPRIILELGGAYNGPTTETV